MNDKRAIELTIALFVYRTEKADYVQLSETRSFTRELASLTDIWPLSTNVISCWALSGLMVSISNGLFNKERN